MEGVWNTVASWAASASGSGMLRGVATTTLGILLATFIRTMIWPLAILLAEFLLKLSCALAGLAAKLVLKRIFPRTAPVRAAVSAGAENSVELQVRDGGRAPDEAQVEDV